MRAVVYFLLVLSLACCSKTKNSTKEKAKVEDNKSKEEPSVELDFSAGPPISIYKTKEDYSDKVAVSLSEDKSKIVSYPHPSDVFYNGKLAYPTKLSDGFLLDNQGINKHVAFLSISLEEYSNYKEVPSLNQLFDLIIDKDPLEVLYFCGNRNSLKNEVEELNSIIENGQLDACECLKR